MNRLPGRQSDGKLPAYAWPGGYPIVYIVADGGTLCPACANGENGSQAADAIDPQCPDDKQWRVIGFSIHYEGPPEICDHCGTEVESAYGDPDSPEEN